MSPSYPNFAETKCYQYLKKIVFVIAICALSNTAVAEHHSDSKFDSIYTHVIVHISQEDINRAFVVSDSLLQNSSNSYQKMKSLMLAAVLSMQNADYPGSLTNALRAAELAKERKDLEWRIRINGFIANIFNEAGLYAEASTYLKEVSRLNKKTKDEVKRIKLQHVLYLELANSESQLGNFKESIRLLNEALLFYDTNRDHIDNDDSRAHILQRLGVSYLALHDYGKAQEYYNLALQGLRDDNLGLKPFIYGGLAEIELQQKNNDKAFDFLQKTLPYLEKSNHGEMRRNYYRNMATYYNNKGMQKEAMHYNRLYADLLDQSSNSSNHIAQELIKRLHEEAQKRDDKNNWLVGISVFLGSSLLIICLYFYFIRRRNRIKIEDILKKSKAMNGRSTDKIRQQPVTFLESEENRSEILMSHETEERLLHSLGEMEKGDFYLTNDISLSDLATMIGTNTKYLSHAINKHKGKDFNTYINDLRVQRVIRDLDTNPKLWSYKIAYIAEEYGFSSHSRFANLFKKHTGISPSMFIDYLRKNSASGK